MESLKYLKIGFECHATKNLAHGVLQLVSAAKKGMHSMTRRCALLPISDPELRCKLFDSLRERNRQKLTRSLQHVQPQPTCMKGDDFLPQFHQICWIRTQDAHPRAQRSLAAVRLITPLDTHTYLGNYLAVQVRQYVCGRVTQGTEKC